MAELREEEMKIENRDVGKYRVLIVHEKVDLYNLSDFKKALLPLAGEKDHLAVELRENRNDLCSSVIGALISMKKMVPESGSFVLINSSETVTALLTLSGLSRFFTTVGDVSELS